MSGRIRVVDYRQERRLIVGGAILSAYPLDGDWSTIEREYWWQGVATVCFPPRPRVLLVGLGGGTQAHLVHRLTTPRLVTAIERDAVILDVAQRWFGLAELGPMEFYCGDAETTAAALARAGRRFDFVMEDAAYADVHGRSRAVVESLVPLVARGGTLVINRHRRGDAGALARALRPRFESVRLRRVRREGENVLLFAEQPIARGGPDTAPHTPNAQGAPGNPWRPSVTAERPIARGGRDTGPHTPNAQGAPGNPWRPSVTAERPIARGGRDTAPTPPALRTPWESRGAVRSPVR